MWILSFNSVDHGVKNSTKEYLNIGDSKETELDLKYIIEYCEHLSTGVVSNIVLGSHLH